MSRGRHTRDKWEGVKFLIECAFVLAGFAIVIGMLALVMDYTQ